jgi:hypothetical protein
VILDSTSLFGLELRVSNDGAAYETDDNIKVPANHRSSISHWEKVHAEDPGFVLVNRYRSSPAMFPMPSREEMRKGRVKGAKVVFARIQISSVKGSEKILKIGYSDDIVVYLNRKPIFSGKNALSYNKDLEHEPAGRRA